MVVEFHFVAGNGPNFHCDPNGPADTYAPNIVAEILNTANAAFSAPEQNAYGSSPQVPDARIRYQLAGDPASPCHGIFLHNQEPQFNDPDPDVFPILVKDNNSIGVAGQQFSGVIALYNIHKNVFQSGGIPLGKWGPLLNHEFGHWFGLCHAFSSDNTCPDMDPVAECGGPNVNDCNTVECGGPFPNSAYLKGCSINTCFNCYCTWGTGNNMMGYNGSQKGLTLSQWAQIYGVMYSQRPAFVLLGSAECADLPPGPSLIIPANTTVSWEEFRFVDQPVEIMPGGVLKITCEVRMGKNLPIIVKRGARLLVIGGRITSWNQSCRWSGIKVLGNSSLEQPAPAYAKDPGNPINPEGAGFVYLNGAILENAVTAISTSGSGSMSSDAYFGGLVGAYAADFVNNGRAVEFMKYDKENKSYFKYCEVFRTDAAPVESVNRGISIWGCHGIEFEEVHFQSIRDYGIAGINYTANIERCGFNGSDYGVRMESTMPNAAKGEMRISNSIFEGNKKDDISSLASPNMVYPITVSGNNMLQGSGNTTMGVRVVGEARFRVSDNLILNKFFGVLGASTGIFSNTVECNTFSGNTIGARILYRNDKLLLLGNSFPDGAGQEIGLDGLAAGPLGKIAAIQGSNTYAAGNCFSNPANAIAAPAARTEKFEYYVPEESQPTYAPCLLPTNNLSDGGVNNYTIKEVVRPIYNCISGLEIGPYTENDLTTIRTIRAQYEAAYLADPGNDSLFLGLTEAGRSQEIILRALLATAWEAGNDSTMIALLEGENTLAAVRARVGLLVGTGDYSAAQSILDTLDTAVQDNVWFKEIMAVNISAAQAGSGFVLSAAQEAQLYVIAGADYSPMSGYACALLSWLKEYDCAIGRPEEFEEPEERLLPPPTQAARLFPNPTKGQFVLESDALQGQWCRLQVMDQSGRPLIDLHQQAKGRISVSTAQLGNGLYWVRLFDERQLIYSGKVTILR